MHILYLHQYFCPPGGSGNNRSFELAKTWIAQGHEVSFITSPAYFPASMRRDEPHWVTEIAGIRLHVVNVHYNHMLPFRQRVKAFLQFYRKAKKLARTLPAPDLIYASSTPLTVGELGRKLSAQMHVPYVYECVDVWPDVPIGMGYLRNPLLINWLNRRTRRIYQSAAEIVALSEGMRDQVLSHGDVPPEKVHVVHNGCDPDAFPFVVRPDRKPVQVMYTGTVGLANGADAIVRLAKAVEGIREDIHFIVLGDGNDLDRVKALAKDLDCRNLEFVDRVPKEEVAGLLDRADIGLVTFAPFKVLEANSANKFYDYLAAGLPVVTNYEGWQAAYIREWNCGLSAPQQDDGSLLANVLRLADDPALRQEMGQNGRRLVEAKFDRKQLARRLIDLFAEVLAK
jgi:glycosyltransferase involved in cell wall biosynthesis